MIKAPDSPVCRQVDIGTQFKKEFSQITKLKTKNYKSACRQAGSKLLIQFSAISPGLPLLLLLPGN